MLPEMKVGPLEELLCSRPIILDLLLVHIGSEKDVVVDDFLIIMYLQILVVLLSHKLHGRVSLISPNLLDSIR